METPIQPSTYSAAGAVNVAVASSRQRILRALYGTVILSAEKIIASRDKSQGGEMPDRILTSHAGSLPRPEDLIALNEQRAEGDFSNVP